MRCRYCDKPCKEVFCTEECQYGYEDAMYEARVEAEAEALARLDEDAAADREAFDQRNASRP
jgi:hypothetical protein